MWWAVLTQAFAEPNLNDQTLSVVSDVDIQAEQNLRLESLQAKVRELELELSMQSDFVQQDAEIIDALSILVDSRQSMPDRVKAVQQLAEKNTELALPFFWDVLEGHTELSLAIVKVLPSFITEDASESVVLASRQIAQKALYTSERHPSNITIAIGKTSFLGDLEGETHIVESFAAATLQEISTVNHPLIAELLLMYVQDSSVPVMLREQALKVLKMNYAEWLIGKETPTIDAPSNLLANQIYSVSSGVTGSVLLGSVGVWGQNETSEAIGYTGGALLGATSGWLIAQEEHPTLAQATLMASSTGWGLAMGEMVASGFDMNSEYGSLSRTLGVAAGTGYGHWARDRNMSLSDVLETDFAGYFGAQVAVGLTDVLSDQSQLQYPQWEAYYPQEYPTDWDVEDEEAAQNAYNDAYERYDLRAQEQQNKKFLTATLGSAVGLGASHLLMEEWEPEPQSVLFAGVWAGQMGIATNLLLPSVGVEYPQGWVRLASHASMAGALYYDHRNPTSYEQSIFSTYGASVGYLLGYGVNGLSRGENIDGSRNASLLSTLGAIGGTTIGNTMDFSTSDWVATGVGLGLTGWHMGSIASISQENGWLSGDQALGLVQTGMGTASLGLLATGQYFEVSSSDAIFLGSSAGWGAYYGALMPIMFGVEDEMSSTEQLLATLITSDVFLAAGTYGLLNDRFESEHTAIPQVLGIAGATIGSLGAFLFTDSSQVVSGAALLGASVGLGSGVLLENRDTTVSMRLSRQHKRYLSKMRIQTSPYVDADGEMGMYVGLSSF